MIFLFENGLYKKKHEMKSLYYTYDVNNTIKS